MDIAQLVMVISQLGFGAAAWRLATTLKTKVDDHETRIVHLERV